MSNELTTIDETKLEAVFTSKGIDDLLDQVKEHIKVFVPDLETKEGRKEFEKMGKKINRSKTYIDDLGKNMLAGKKAEIKKVDNIRKYYKDEMDQLKEDFLEPLALFEAKEKERVRKLQERAEVIRVWGIVKDDSGQYYDIERLREQLRGINDIDIDSSWEEWRGQAETMKESAISDLTFAINKLADIALEKEEAKEKLRIETEAQDKRREVFTVISQISAIANISPDASPEKIEEEKAKLEELYKHEFGEESESAKNCYTYSLNTLNMVVSNRERAQKELNDRMKADAEAKAKREADDALNVEKEKLELKAKEDRKKSEDEAAEAKEKLAKIERDKAQEVENQRKREADTQHRSKINNEALDSLALCNAFITQEQAKDVVKAIVMGNIKNVSINY